MSTIERICIEEKISESGDACSLLAARTGLPKGRIKDAMNKGALRWRKGGRGAFKRQRRATAILAKGDEIAFFYDETLLTLKPPLPICISDEGQYSVWYKPAGLLSQGSEYGDHYSLLRQVELHSNPRREAFLVHRIDRETTGLILVAHNERAAAKLSQLFSGRDVEKHYLACVSGEIAEVGAKFTIDQAIDGKNAVSHITVLDSRAPASVQSEPSDRAQDLRKIDHGCLLDVRIETGRKHQIRKHLQGAGFPVIGDHRFGGPQHPMLCLTSSMIAFRCPLSHKMRRYTLERAAVEWLGGGD
ncbi:Putative pseudouridine synthase A [gamma proteobacterium HdN1]|nr:Putative pseudouridine synthase A [gamma proteobacterium HdN1]